MTTDELIAAIDDAIARCKALEARHVELSAKASGKLNFDGESIPYTLAEPIAQSGPRA